MRQRILITLLLYFLGAAVYLSLSGAPFRVHVVALPFHLVFLLLAAIIISVPSLSRRRRALGLGLLVLLGSIVHTILQSRVIHALYPLHPSYFASGFAALAVELLVFLGWVWLAERALFLALRHRRPTRPGLPPP